MKLVSSHFPLVFYYEISFPTGISRTSSCTRLVFVMLVVASKESPCIVGDSLIFVSTCSSSNSSPGSSCSISMSPPDGELESFSLS